MDFDGDGEVDSDEEVDITPTVATQEQVSHEIKARVPRDADVTVVRKTLYNPTLASQLARLTAVMDGADATITAIQTTKGTGSISPRRGLPGMDYALCGDALCGSSTDHELHVRLAAQLSEKVEVQDMRKSMMSSEDWERDIHANVLYVSRRCALDVI